MDSSRQAKFALKIPGRLSRTRGRKLSLALLLQFAFNFGLPFQWLRFGTLSDSTCCVLLRKPIPHWRFIRFFAHAHNDSSYVSLVFYLPDPYRKFQGQREKHGVSQETPHSSRNLSCKNSGDLGFWKISVISDHGQRFINLLSQINI